MDYISKLDIIFEDIMEMDKPISATDISREANVASQNRDTSKQVSELVKAQEEARKKSEEAKRKILKPQFDKIQDSLNKINTDIAQGSTATDTSKDQYTGLDREMDNVRQLMNTVEKSI